MEKYTIGNFCLMRIPAFPKRYLTKVNDSGTRGVPDDGAVLREISATRESVRRCTAVLLLNFTPNTGNG